MSPFRSKEQKEDMKKKRPSLYKKWKKKYGEKIQKTRKRPQKR